jgi:hypothetical protein
MATISHGVTQRSTRSKSRSSHCRAPNQCRFQLDQGYPGQADTAHKGGGQNSAGLAFKGIQHRQITALGWGHNSPGGITARSRISRTYTSVPRGMGHNCPGSSSIKEIQDRLTPYRQKTHTQAHCGESVRHFSLRVLFAYPSVHQSVSQPASESVSPSTLYCSEPSSRSCSVEMTVKCTLP